MSTEPDWDDEYDREGSAWPDDVPTEEPADAEEADR